MVAQTRSPETRRSGLRRVAGHVFGIAAVVTIMLIGNLRVQASEAGPRAAAPALVGASASMTASEDWRLTAVSNEPVAEEKPDGVEVVPAIYAWNPDVRFVYYRHVSKWM